LSDAQPFRFNRVVHPDDFSSAELRPYAIDDLHIAPDYWAAMVRKPWEWAMVLMAMDRHGYLRRDVTALGVGAGFEAVPFALTNRIRMAVASDLYGQTAFADREATSEMLRDPSKYWPHHYEPSRLLVMNADATDLPFADASFDVLFSCSSIEHFGESDRIRRSMQSAWRVLRPGGMYALSVDYLYRSPKAWLPRDRRGHMHEFLTKRDVETMVVNTPGFTLREPVDYSVPEHLVTNVYDIETEQSESGQPLPHLWLRWHDHYLTSLFLLLFKDG
jgi:SAM-dependent methyltransferase